jgi:hypothetical protein
MSAAEGFPGNVAVTFRIPAGTALGLYYGTVTVQVKDNQSDTYSSAAYVTAKVASPSQNWLDWAKANWLILPVSFVVFFVVAAGVVAAAAKRQRTRTANSQKKTQQISQAKKHNLPFFFFVAVRYINVR